MLLYIDGVVRLATNVEMKYTSAGTAIASFSVVSSEKYKSNDEQKENVCFIDCSVFGKLAETANQYLTKGQQILIRGRLKQDIWVNNNGDRRSKHSLILDGFEMLGKKDDNKNTTNSEEIGIKPPERVEVEYPQAPASRSQTDIYDDDEIYF